MSAERTHAASASAQPLASPRDLVGISRALTRRDLEQLDRLYRKTLDTARTVAHFACNGLQPQSAGTAQHAENDRAAFLAALARAYPDREPELQVAAYLFDADYEQELAHNHRRIRGAAAVAALELLSTECDGCGEGLTWYTHDTDLDALEARCCETVYTARAAVFVVTTAPKVERVR